MVTLAPTPVLDEKTQKDIREMLKAEIEFEYKVFGFNSGTAKGHNLMAENTDADIMMIMNPRCYFGANLSV